MSYISARIFPEFAFRDTSTNRLLKVRISPRTIAAKIGNFSKMRGCFEKLSKDKNGRAILFICNVKENKCLLFSILFLFLRHDEP